MIGNDQIRCRCCGRFVGNSNCSTAGSVADGYRGLLVCDACLRRRLDEEFENTQPEPEDDN